MASPQPYIISVSDLEIAALKQKLELTKFPDELSDAEWKYGVPLKDVQRLVAFKGKIAADGPRNVPATA